MRVGIVGCGTGGQAAAVLLHRAGHDVTVYERSRVLEPIGAGLLLQPTGAAVLAELGVGERVRTLATPIERLWGVTQGGRTVLDVRYQDLQPGLAGWGVHRGALFATLLEAMQARGINVHTGVECAGYRVRADGRADLIGPESRVIDEVDLLVVADGARSTLRTGLQGVQRAAPYPWGALWFVAEESARVRERAQTLYQVYAGTRGMVGFLPSGRRGPDGAATVSVFWSVRVRDMDAVRAAGLDAFKRGVRALIGNAQDRVEDLLAQLTDIRQLISATYHDVVLRQAFDGPVVFLGDAAHAMSPQLGQGANLALVDASVLADSMRRSSDVQAALASYDAARRANVRYYQLASRWLTPLFQSDHAWLGPVRDAFMGPCCRVPMLRRMMLDSLVGSKTGLMPWSRGPIGAASWAC